MRGKSTGGIPSVRAARAVTTAPGRQFGSRYLLEDLIGRGTTGKVYRAQVKDGGADVAVKLLKDELTHDVEFVTRFLLEGRLLKRVDHPNVARVLDVVAEGDRLGLVSDLVDGGDLRYAVPFPTLPSVAVSMVAQVARGLDAVHRANIVHGDLKPENVLVDRSGGELRLRLTDFGVSHLIDAKGGDRSQPLLGAAGYLPPEAALGLRTRSAGDVYALGIMLYEMIAGRRPFSSPTSAGLLRAHVEQAPVRPEGISDACWQLIEAMLAKEPSRRPAAAEVADRLASLDPGPGAARARDLATESPRARQPLGGPVDLDAETGTALPALGLTGGTASISPRTSGIIVQGGSDLPDLDADTGLMPAVPGAVEPASGRPGGGEPDGGRDPLWAMLDEGRPAAEHGPADHEPSGPAPSDEPYDSETHDSETYDGETYDGETYDGETYDGEPHDQAHDPARSRGYEEFYPRPADAPFDDDGLQATLISRPVPAAEPTRTSRRRPWRTIGSLPPRSVAVAASVGLVVTVGAAVALSQFSGSDSVTTSAAADTATHSAATPSGSPTGADLPGDPASSTGPDDTGTSTGGATTGTGLPGAGTTGPGTSGTPGTPTDGTTGAASSTTRGGATRPAPPPAPTSTPTPTHAAPPVPVLTRAERTATTLLDRVARFSVSGVGAGEGSITSVTIYSDPGAGAMTLPKTAGTAAPYAFTVTGLENGRQYTFTAQVCNSFGKCTRSAPVVETPFTIPTLPAPSGTQAGNVITANWAALQMNGNPHTFSCTLNVVSSGLDSDVPKNRPVAAGGGSITWTGRFLSHYYSRETCTDGAYTVTATSPYFTAT